jgi:hypothetical protein
MVTDHTLAALRKMFKLQEIRSTLDSFSTSGLPSVVELKAVDHMILTTFKNWDVPLDLLYKRLRTALARSLASSLSEKVGQWRATKLFEEMHQANIAFLDEHLTHMQAHVNRSLRLERAKPITRDEELMTRYIAEEETDLADARLQHRYRLYNTKLVENGGKEHGAGSWDDKARKQAASLLQPDTYAREISVMARIKAYYHVASTRFVDHVVQSVEAELLVTFKEELYHDLMMVLKVFGEDGKYLGLFPFCQGSR